MARWKLYARTDWEANACSGGEVSLHADLRVNDSIFLQIESVPLHTIEQAYSPVLPIHRAKDLLPGLSPDDDYHSKRLNT
jgi:hypothetical protein